MLLVSSGANYIKYLLHKKYVNEDVKIIVLDALTYAGNLGTIKDDIDNKRCVFVRGDIRDRELIDKLFAENDIDYLVNFAAESHVDRSIEDPQLFLNVNILGTQNLMDAARRAWVTGKDEQGYPTWKEGKRYHQVSPRVMARLVLTVTSLKKLRYALTALIQQVKPVPICLLWHTTTHIICPSASHVARTTMDLTTSLKS